ncbi:hypothetical protein SZN_29160 [Streptomyces zinciresistens K42]|uniref:Uncharacterized protein n=1 Tax=Streptomyces zinciresistens K42 TaxID=700597 RepID=G2GJY9_9ACTN|nr:hypothetical protein [Streptomyces zinciresistens]EGX56162.1 hypothetical protein SZN_29160 [Streptomyces zinciresistens K42]
MDDHRGEAPGGNADPIPRDLPDQQADGGEDPWEVPVRSGRPGRSGGHGESEAGPDDTDGDADDVPDTDEAGTGRRGERQSGTVHPEHPAPEEPTG